MRASRVSTRASNWPRSVSIRQPPRVIRSSPTHWTRAPPSRWVARLADIALMACRSAGCSRIVTSWIPAVRGRISARSRRTVSGPKTSGWRVSRATIMRAVCTISSSWRRAASAAARWASSSTPRTVANSSSSWARHSWRPASRPASSPAGCPSAHAWARIVSASARASSSMADASCWARDSSCLARSAARCHKGAESKNRRARSRTPRVGCIPTKSTAGSPPGGITTERALITLDNYLVLPAPSDDDLTHLLETADGSHNALLGFLHVPQTHRTEVFDLLAEHFSCPLGHVAEDPLGHVFAGDLEGQGPDGHVDFRDDLAQRTGVQRDDDLKDEHALLDFFGQLRVLLLKSLEYGPLGLPVYPVEHLDGHLDAADGRILLPHEGSQALFQRRFDLFQHLGGRPVQGRKPPGHLHLPVRRQSGQDGPRLVGMEVSHDQTNRLGMLVLDEVQQLGRVSLAGKVKRPHLQGGGQALDQRRRPLRPDGLLQHLAGVLQPALVDIFLGQRQLAELLEDLVSHLGFHMGHVGDFPSDALDLVVPEMLEHLGRVLGPQGDE